MTRSLSVVAACAAIALLAACSTGGGRQPEEQLGPVYTATPEEARYLSGTEPVEAGALTLYVNGMGCPLCATNIDKQLERLDGVGGVAVDLGAGKVGLRVSGERRTSPKRLRDAVEEAGFTLVKIERVEGGTK